MERIVIDKINYLSEKGYEISVAYFGNKDDVPFFPLDKRVNRIALCNYEGTLSFMSRIKYGGRLIQTLKEVLANNNPDILVNANAPLVSWILPFMRKDTPKVFEFHFSYQGLKIMNRELYGNNVFKAYINDLLRKTIYPLYTKCVALTEYDKKAWGFKNMVVIPNFTCLRAGQITRMHEKKIISVGRLCYQKDFLILIDAWSIVSGNYRSWQLDIWGNGEEKELLEKQIEKLGLKGIVNIKGISQNIGEEYPNYSLFVLPSRYEGFPLVLVEAMQFGLPCIGFNIPGNNTIIEDGKNGQIVKERTPEALAETIIDTISNSDKMNMMSKNAIASIQKFKEEKVMVMWEKLFMELTREYNEKD